jgi:hypothetical protein
LDGLPCVCCAAQVCDPAARISAADALHHAYFDRLKVPARQRTVGALSDTHGSWM